MDSRLDGPLKAALSFSCFAKFAAFCLFHSYRENVEVRRGRLRMGVSITVPISAQGA
jgi:hypothetical protein